MAARRPVISFDLDDCLICYDDAVPCEPDLVPRPLRPWFREPLRRGTRKLADELVRRGWDVWVFTTSYRSPRKVRWWFRFHGIRLAGVVNQAVYERAVSPDGWQRPSKYPPAFNIDLHVDDSEGVRMEGERHGFDVVVVRPDDPGWAGRVLAAADAKAAMRSTGVR